MTTPSTTVQVLFAHAWTDPATGTSYRVGQVATVSEDLGKRLVFNGIARYAGTTPPLVPPGTIDDVELGLVLAGFEPKVPRAGASPGYVVSLAQDGQALVLTPAPAGGGGGGTTVVQAPDATGSVKGLVRLGGDLGGTADSPTVPGLGQRLTLEQVQDAVAEMIVAGSNVTKVYDDATGTLTLSSSGGGTTTGPSGLDAEQVRDLIGGVLRGGPRVTITPSDVADTITIDVESPNIATMTAGQVRDIIAATLKSGTNVTLVTASGPPTSGTNVSSIESVTINATGGSGNASPDLIDGGTPTSTYGTPLSTAELIRDTIGTALVAGPGIVVTIDDVNDRITLSSTGSTDPEIVRDTMATALVAGEGIAIDKNDALDRITLSTTGNLTTLRNLLQAGVGIDIQPSGDGAALVVSATGGGTGGGGTVDAAAVRDIVGGLIRGGTNIQAVYDDAAAVLTITTSATVNASDDVLLDRGNHFGTQLASSISDFTPAVRALVNAAGTATNPHTSATATRNTALTVNFWATWPATPTNAAPQDHLLVPADGATGPATVYVQPFATAASWTSDGSGSTVAYSTDRFTSSPGSLKVTSTTAGVSPTRAASPKFPLAAGARNLTITVRASTSLTDRGLVAQYRLYNASNVQVAFGTAAAVGGATADDLYASSGSFTNYAWTMLVPSDATITQMEVVFIVTNVAAVGEVFYFDDVTVG